MSAYSSRLTASIYAVTLLAFVSAMIDPLSDEFINHINSVQDLWVAGRNFHEDTPLSHIKGLMGLLRSSEPELQSLTHEKILIESLPEHFDARKRWPECPTIKEIRDQGSCGSCWAFSSVAAMSDRICIASNAATIVHISAQDALTCSMTSGCHGGYPGRLWQYWTETGLVSGGPYNSSEGCQPYSIQACEHHVTGPRPSCSTLNPDDNTPECSKECREGYDTSFEDDKYYGETAYEIAGEDNMRAEIYSRGPITGTMDVYADFVHYKSGVYKRTSDIEVGAHAIKIMGWGVERGVKYWLVANSWNSDWGDQGVFKIIRGVGTEGLGLGNTGFAGDPQL